MENRIAKNRRSPSNEAELIREYKNLNKSARKLGDNMDIAAVTTKNGEKGHGLLSEKFNRGRDKDLHRVRDFISDKELKKAMNSKWLVWFIFGWKK